MKLTNTTVATALQSAFVAPARGWAFAGVRTDFRRVDAPVQIPALNAAGDAGMATGPRSWSPPIT